MHKGTLHFIAGIAVGVALAPAIVRPARAQDKPQTIGEFPDLGAGLLATPGCLGVQSFAVNHGKTQVISAWFENRKAMEAWYYGDMHQGAMHKFFPGMGNGHKPFAQFKDEKVPILVIASVTPGSKPMGNGSKLQVDQIAIEGYTPIPGGVALGGTFSPEKLEVPGMLRIPAGD